MKILKRVLLVLLVIILLLQIPIIYRRYQTGKLAQRIAELQSQRVNREEAQFKEYKGVIHVHTHLGGHSTGSFEELIAAANANDLDFVLMTEHYSDKFDTSALTLNGVYGTTLFVGGNEIDTADGDRFLMIPGSGEAASFKNMPTNAVLEKLHSENRLAFVTYPEKFKSWDSNFDGTEVFSLHTSAKQMNPFTGIFDLIWSYSSYPELTLARSFRRPDANLQKFDEIAARRKITLFAGADAHSNIGFHLFGDDAGNKLINIKLDPYETIFRIARIHVLIEREKEFNKVTLLEAIKAGRHFIGFDALGDTTGFRFSIESKGMSATMGETIGIADDLEFLASTPIPLPRTIFRNGLPWGNIAPDEKQLSFEKKDRATPGTYRIEVYRTDLGPPFDKMPWIISNPIFVR